MPKSPEAKYSCCKILNGFQDSEKFGSATLFILQSKGQRLTLIHLHMIDRTLKAVELVNRAEGLGPFSDLKEGLEEKMGEAGDGTLLVCQEKPVSLGKILEFATGHLDGFVDPALVTALKDHIGQIVTGEV